MSDLSLQDVLEIAQNALRRSSDVDDRVEELEDTVERLEFRVGQLEAQLDTSQQDYSTLDRDEKVQRVRRHLLEKADVSPQNAAMLDYEGVQWEVFDGQPSPSHCYDLMRWAADHDAFRYDESDRTRVTVDLDDLENDLEEILPAKNRRGGTTPP